MPPIFPGRHTARIEGSFVVFIIGMRINRLRAVHQWLPAARAMTGMLRELAEDRDLGLLHAEPYVYWRGSALVQYWRSFEHLERYARVPSGRHQAAWQRFYASVGTGDSVGIWHETYRVEADQYKCLYVNMPKMGMALAGEHARAGAGHESGRRRMETDGSRADEEASANTEPT